MPYADKQKRVLYHRDYMRRYRDTHPELSVKMSEYDRIRNRRKTCKSVGITVEQYDATFLAQGKKCAICKSGKSGGRGWNLDHDHKTNTFRGILCHNCNLGLGNFKDSLAVLDAAKNYLRKVSPCVVLARP